MLEAHTTQETAAELDEDAVSRGDCSIIQPSAHIHISQVPAARHRSDLQSSNTAAAVLLRHPTGVIPMSLITCKAIVKALNYTKPDNTCYNPPLSQVGDQTRPTAPPGIARTHNCTPPLDSYSTWLVFSAPQLLQLPSTSKTLQLLNLNPKRRLTGAAAAAASSVNSTPCSCAAPFPAALPTSPCCCCCCWGAPPLLPGFPPLSPCCCCCCCAVLSSSDSSNSCRFQSSGSGGPAAEQHNKHH